MATLDRLHHDHRGTLMGYLGPAGLFWMLWGIAFLSSRLSQDAEAIREVNEIGLLAGCFGAVLIPWLIYSLLANRRYRARLKEQLENHQNPESLLPGEEGTEFQIRQYIPWAFRFGYPTEKNRDRAKHATELLAKNIDWYLKPPARFIRLRWFEIYGLILPLIAYMTLLYYWDMSGYFLVKREFSHYQPEFLIFICIYVLMAAISLGEDVRQAVRIGVYREFVMDWYQNHPLEPVDE